MRSLAIVALALTLVGCSSTHTLTPGSLDGAEINHALAGKTAEVTLTDGRVVPARSVVVLADSTTWIEPETRAFVRMPTSEVVSVTRRSRGRGFLQGALITGLTAAVAVGTYAAFDTGDWGPYGDLKMAVGFTVGVVSFLPGAIPGGAIGYERGARQRYKIDPVTPAELTAENRVAANSALVVRRARR